MAMISHIDTDRPFNDIDTPFTYTQLLTGSLSSEADK